MKRILITGFNGFVAGHFIDYLESRGIRAEVLGVDVTDLSRDISTYGSLKIGFSRTDLLEAGRLEALLYDFRPQWILHLASYSSVGFSWKNPSLSFRNNMNIFLNLMELIREAVPSCRVLSVGSSEEYGNVSPEDVPLAEGAPLSPVSPYAVARVSQEQLSKVYSDGFGLDIVMTRSFNHIGPGQRDAFVVSSFARQLVEIKKGLKGERRLLTGDISVVRDFLDVRDVVDAYYRLFLDGEKGQVYNICSGSGVSLREIIDMMCRILDIEVEIITDPSLLRPSDNRIIIGSNEKLRRVTGWTPKLALKKSLEDVILYWSERI
jgi:GDP-4-dehydro-6-deoxy-D-mannose reductase